MYAAWISTVELSITRHHGMELPRSRRAHGARWVEGPVRQAAHRRKVHLRDQRAQWWTQVHTLIAGVSRHLQRGNGTHQL
eukprot:6859438-Pyramimonas_sp.AAC.1